VGFDELPGVACAGAGQLEGLHGEREVLVVRVIHQKSVIYGLLQTLCWVASWDEGAGCPCAVALLDPGGLGEGLVVGVHPVHDDPPLTLGVHSPEGHEVCGG